MLLATSDQPTTAVAAQIAPRMSDALTAP